MNAFRFYNGNHDKGKPIMVGGSYDCQRCGRTHPAGPCENFRHHPLWRKKETTPKAVSVVYLWSDTHAKDLQDIKTEWKTIERFLVANEWCPVCGWNEPYFESMRSRFHLPNNCAHERLRSVFDGEE